MSQVIESNVQSIEEKMFLIQGLDLLNEKILKNKTIVEIHKKTGDDTDNLITYYNESSYKVLALKRRLKDQIILMTKHENDGQ